MSGRKSKKPVGWEGEPMRHALARQGVETTPPHFGQVFAGAGKRMAQVEVAHFDDLSEEAKQRALDRYRDINVDWEWWDFDGLIDFSEKELDAMGPEFEKKYMDSKKMLFDYKIGYFDIGRGSYLQFESIEVSDDDLFYEWLGIPDSMREGTGLYFTFENPTREKNTVLEFGWDVYDIDVTPKEQMALDKAKEKFSDKVEEGLRILRDEYESRLTDEAVAEMLIDNEYEFTSDGKIF